MNVFRLHQLAETSAGADADRPALVLDAECATYGELVGSAARLAGLLAAFGVLPRDRVALVARKGVRAATALHGILRAGAAYVPLDPAAPAARHALIVRDCAARCVVGEAASVRALLAAGVPGVEAVILLEDEVPAALDPPPGVRIATWSALAAQDPARAAHPGTEHDLAALLYTSGSTGTPKGVMLSHRNILSFVLWAAGEFGLRADDRVANHAPFHFDLSTFDYFAAAAVGATVHPIPAREAAFPSAVAERTARDRHSVVYATPSTWIQMLTRGGLAARDLSAIRLALYAGEVFPPASLDRFLSVLPAGASCFNLYGPTETNVCTFARVSSAPPEGEPASIGHACPNCEVFALDESGRLQGPGGEGELHVAGGTVMQGYWNDPERTARALVPHPFVGSHAQRAYRTGDLVRVAADGSFLFLGRRDHQVKVRGYRVELGEVESVLAANSGVVEAAVIARPHEEHGAVLLAAVVPGPGADVDERALRRTCAARLPHYMVPERIVVRADLPRTSSGKIDRVRLGEELAAPAREA